MKKFMVIMVALIAIVGGVCFAGTHYFVKTSDGIKMYPKSEFSLSGTYVDMNNMSFLGLRDHIDLVTVMASKGDFVYVPGGATLEKLAEAGQNVVDAVNKFDSEYQISSNLKEIERIGINNWQQANNQYDISGKVGQAVNNLQNQVNQLNNQYDISGKAEQAANNLQNAANQLNNWLKSK